MSNLIALLTLAYASRKVALLEVQGKEYRLTPIPLRTVRPFVLGEVILSDAAEDEGFDLNDRMAISKYLRAKASSQKSDMKMCITYAPDR